MDFMFRRQLWKHKIENAWEKAPICWLSGVRRVGKTTLSQEFESARYVNCDLPGSVRALEDPEVFFSNLEQRQVIFDEIHRLPDPSLVLKIAADEFKHLKVLATGSSTLAATEKFRDSLTGRKRLVRLTPVLYEELPEFGIEDLQSRLLKGGLPPALLSSEHDLEFYAEWMDSFYSRDVQELFKVEKRSAFLKLFETVLRNSGGMADMTGLSKHTSLSRPTVLNYIDVLEISQALHILRPYAAGGRREILAQPKIYGFDTGFVAFARGWSDLRAEDCGNLWEHLVLDTLLSISKILKIQFWRDKQQREIDFVVPQGRQGVDAIECKWNIKNFETRNLKAFRENYNRGRNFVVSPMVQERYTISKDGLDIAFVGLQDVRGFY